MSVLIHKLLGLPRAHSQNCAPSHPFLEKQTVFDAKKDVLSGGNGPALGPENPVVASSAHCYSRSRFPDFVDCVWLRKAGGTEEQQTSFQFAQESGARLPQGRKPRTGAGPTGSINGTVAPRLRIVQQASAELTV
jgi:hypothetical protein